MLPTLPYRQTATRNQEIAFRGLNLSENIQDGDLRDSQGLSTQYYPCITQRRKRGSVDTNVTDLFEWDGKLVVVKNNTLYYDGNAICQVSAARKQFAVVNTKLVVWPDQIVVDLTTSNVTDYTVGLVSATSTTDADGKELTVDTTLVGANTTLYAQCGNRWYHGCSYAPSFTNGQWSGVSIREMNTNGLAYNYGSTTLGAYKYFVPYKTESGEYKPEMLYYVSSIYYPSQAPSESEFAHNLNTDGVYGVVTSITSNTCEIEGTSTTLRFTGTLTAKYNLINSTTGSVILSGYFQIGDAVDISVPASSVSVKGARIVSIDDTNHKLVFANGTFAAGATYGSTTVKRSIPHIDYICESENRLWGVSNSQTNRIYDASTETWKEYTSRCIYASALGKPMNFYDFDGVDTDSYAVAVGSEGDFTGICNYNGVCCWKENKLHKMFGSYPSEYYLQEYDIPGVQDGSYRSLQIINEVLYYNGVYGVYAFNGNTPSLISYNLGRSKMTNASGGTDGVRYYISAARDGGYVLYTYDTIHGLWLKDSASNAQGFCRIHGDLYMLIGGTIYKYDDNVNEAVTWVAEFCQFTEQNFDKRRYIRLMLRVDMSGGSNLQVYVKYDRGSWTQVLTRSADSAVTLNIPIPSNRCDRFSVKLTGTGQVTIRSMAREYTAGGING